MASVFKRGGKANRGGYWYVAWVDHAGKRRTRCTKTTDKAAAERIAAKLQSDTALRREGVIDPSLDAAAKESRRSIESHLEAFQAKLESAHRDPKHVRETVRQIRAIAKYGEMERAIDIAADKVIAAIKKIGAERKTGFGPRTVQAYLTAIKSFTKWLADPVNPKLIVDPLSSTKKPNPKINRRLERRALSHDEWQHLLKAVGSGPDRFGLSSGERSLLYRLAIQTGLRANEIRNLGPGNLFLDVDPPCVTCDAGSAKNRKTARQFIDRGLAEDLRRLAGTGQGGVGVIRLPHECDVAEMLRADLAAARAAWIESAADSTEAQERSESDFLLAKDHDGRWLDFHALRHTCGAWLASAGVHPKVVQGIMRHSTITLTMDTYGHLFPGHEADAAAKLFSLLAPIDAQRCIQQTGVEIVRAGASRGRRGGSLWTKKEGRKPFQVAALCDTSLPNATPCESAPSRTRTWNPLIKSRRGNQLLAEKSSDLQVSAALGAAVETDSAIVKLIEAWPRLTGKVRAELMRLATRRTSKPTRAK